MKVCSTEKALIEISTKLDIIIALLQKDKKQPPAKPELEIKQYEF